MAQTVEFTTPHGRTVTSPSVVMAALRSGHPSGARGEARESVFVEQRAKKTPSLADARAMDGRDTPGHDGLNTR
ncbi:MAG: hypothetical protein ACJ8EL_19815 [Rhizomicrobium sp.]